MDAPLPQRYVIEGGKSWGPGEYDQKIISHDEAHNECQKPCVILLNGQETTGFSRIGRKVNEARTAS